MNPITIDSIRARRAAADGLLWVVKQWSPERALAALKDDAVREHAAYPQYAGYFDRYRLGRVTRRIKTKAGVAFEVGDLCIFAPTLHSDIPGLASTCVDAYSNRNGCVTVLRASDVKEVL
jgi:hypothetical protein